MNKRLVIFALMLMKLNVASAEVYSFGIVLKHSQNRILDSSFMKYGEVKQRFVAPTALVNPFPTKDEDNCTELQSMIDCRKGSDEIFTYDFKKIFESLNPSSKCACLDHKIKIEFEGRENYLQELQSNLRIELRNNMSQKINRKLINDLSAIVEDVSYYTTTLPAFFGADINTQQKNALKYQCAEKEPYKKALSSKCGKSFEDPEINGKLDDIFEGIASKDDNLDTKFTKLMKKIMELDDVKAKDGKPYTRIHHDQTRATLNKTDPEYRFIDSIIQKFMREKKFTSRNSAPRPLDFTADIIMKEARKNPKEFIAKYMDPLKMGPDLYASYKASIESNNNEKNIFFSGVSKAMGLHPGFEAMMLDSKIFDKVSEKAGQPFSLSGLLEDKSSIMAEVFSERCEQHVQDVADALCSSVDDFSSDMSAEDLRSFLNAKPVDEDIFKQLTCRSPSDSSFLVKQFFSPNPSQKNSDLIDRLENVPDKQTNPFTKLVNALESGNEDVKAVVRESFEQTGFAKGLRGERIASSMFGSDEQDSSILTRVGADRSKVENASNSFSPSVAPTKISEASASSATSGPSVSSVTKNVSDNNEFRPPTRVPLSVPRAPVTSSVAPYDATSKTVSGFDPKKEFREFLANESNQETVDKLINQTDDSMLKELQLLRDSYTRNQQKLNDMTFETEKMRLKMLEDEIKGLESKKNKIVSDARTDEENRRESQQDRKPVNSAIRDTKREIASLTQFADVGGAAAGSSFGQSEGGKGDLSGGGGMGARAFSSPGLNDLPPILVSSYSARSSGSEVRSQDLSLEIMTYLQNSEPDVQTLLKLRTTGMLYKYKIIENGKEVEKEFMIDYRSLTDDAKKLIDHKIASQGIDPSQIDQIERKLGELKRSYTISSLKLLLGEKMKK